MDPATEAVIKGVKMDGVFVDGVTLDPATEAGILVHSVDDVFVEGVESLLQCDAMASAPDIKGNHGQFSLCLNDIKYYNYFN